MAKYCASCGTNLPQGAQFCPGCGQSAARTPDGPELGSSAQRPGGGSGLLIGLGVLVAVLGVGLIATLAYLLLTSEDTVGEAEPTPEAGSNKQEVAVEEGFVSESDIVERVDARYVGPSGADLSHVLYIMRSPEAADNIRQEVKDVGLSYVVGGWVDERPVEASGRRVGTLTVIGGTGDTGKKIVSEVVWTNRNLVAWTAAEEGAAAENFYESVPY